MTKPSFSLCQFQDASILTLLYWYRLFAVIIIGVIAACTIGLAVAFKEHFWLIPIFIMCNVLASWWLLKNLVLKSFVFSYGQSFITNRELKSLNE